MEATVPSHLRRPATGVVVVAALCMLAVVLFMHQGGPEDRGDQAASGPVVQPCHRATSVREDAEVMVLQRCKVGQGAQGVPRQATALCCGMQGCCHLRFGTNALACMWILIGLLPLQTCHVCWSIWRAACGQTLWSHKVLEFVAAREAR